MILTLLSAPLFGTRVHITTRPFTEGNGPNFRTQYWTEEGCHSLSASVFFSTFQIRKGLQPERTSARAPRGVGEGVRRATGSCPKGLQGQGRGPCPCTPWTRLAASRDAAANSVTTRWRPASRFAPSPPRWTQTSSWSTRIVRRFLRAPAGKRPI